MSSLPPYFSIPEKIWHYTFWVICGAVLFFLIFPLLVITPLSFNAVPFFTFTKEMLAFDPAGYSLVWYEEFFTSLNWQGAIRNSVIIAFFSTIIATFLGTLASLGLSRPQMPYRTLLMSLLISPMIVPLIISAAGMFFFYSRIGLQATHLGVILAHAVLGTPFVVITVTATLSGFDHSVTRAAASLGSDPVNTFMKITLPLILPGVISGGLFAFVTSFDEVVVVLFLAGLDNTTIPIQMWTGLREQLSPTILAVATCLIVLSTLVLVIAELLRRRSERIRGIRR